MALLILGIFFIGCALGVMAGVLIGVWVHMKDEHERRDRIRRYREAQL